MSMIVINFQNVIELIFSDKKIRKLLPDFTDTFKQWDLANVVGLRHIEKKCKIDLLQKLPEYTNLLSLYFNDNITIDKGADYRIVKLIKTSLEDIEDVLNDSNMTGEPVIHREGDQIYVCFWS